MHSRRNCTALTSVAWNVESEIQRFSSLTGYQGRSGSHRMSFSCQRGTSSLVSSFTGRPTSGPAGAGLLSAIRRSRWFRKRCTALWRCRGVADVRLLGDKARFRCCRTSVCFSDHPNKSVLAFGIRLGQNPQIPSSQSLVVPTYPDGLAGNRLSRIGHEKRDYVCNALSRDHHTHRNVCALFFVSVRD